ncbi:CDP-glycerol glycerophosphotransferase family protein [Macrococcus lamae]|uniref:CDP-glycerol glycerophosphotransferase family protein n=1 Tax=Macrococcus lamae TaxID=198484 RepID=A0A4R6BWK9_9STAP|nr:CDP-glycerol glycerophosphotransferase family protein [Macrococcus lamae]TDM12402.1 CDP-glycerol glycerophosphotransferase family protein [Macrococcus lamae]
MNNLTIFIPLIHPYNVNRLVEQLEQVNDLFNIVIVYNELSAESYNYIRDYYPLKKITGNQCFHNDVSSVINNELTNVTTTYTYLVTEDIEVDFLEYFLQLPVSEKALFVAINKEFMYPFNPIYHCNRLKFIIFNTELLNNKHCKIRTALKFYKNFDFLLQCLENIDPNDIEFCPITYYLSFNECNHLLYEDSPCSLRNEMMGEFIKLYIERQPNDYMNDYYDYVISKMINPSNQYNHDFLSTIFNEIALFYENNYAFGSRLKQPERYLITSKKKRLFLYMQSLRRLIRSLSRLVKTPQQLPFSLYEIIAPHMPIFNQSVVFESFSGKSFSDNPKAIYEYMLSEYPDYKFYWVFDHPEQVTISGNAKKVKRFSMTYYFIYATSKYWVSNARLSKFLIKRKEQIYLQTWHGTPLKKLGLDIEDVKMPNTTTIEYRLRFLQESDRWDYLISPNQYSTKIFQRAFGVNREIIIETGYPRNDRLITSQNNLNKINDIKRRLNLPLNKKIVMYAPTWRDDDFVKLGTYQFKLQLDLNLLKEHLGSDTILLMRMHYLISNNLNIEAYSGFAYDVSSYEDITDLYLISDVLITDYSSVFFDYSILKRPQLFFSYDLEKYKNDLRGFYINYIKEIPGPLVENSTDLLRLLEHLEDIEKIYKDKINDFHLLFNQLEDGSSTKRVVNCVFANK